MTKKLGPTLIPLDPEYREAVLSYVVVPQEGNFSGTAVTVGDLLSEAQACLKVVNDRLSSDPMMTLTARNLMKQSKKRGKPRIVADIEGRVSLYVHYGEQPESITPSPPQGLPTLEALRKEAQDLGIDISHLGRQKLKIMDLIVMSRDVRDNHSPNPFAVLDPTVDDPQAKPRRLRDEVSESTLPKRVRIPKAGEK